MRFTVNCEPVLTISTPIMEEPQCFICGLKLPQYLVQCTECGLWFCNQVHDGVSHALQHVRQHQQKGEQCTLSCPYNAIGCEDVCC